MVGTVRDQTGALVVGAELAIRNTDTDITRKAISNQRGEFTEPNLPPGPYQITATHAGFRTVRQTDIVLEMDQVARMDIKLDVGAVSQTVEVVEAGAPLINTDNGTKGQVMTADEIVEMPLNGRNITDLGTLAAGITPNNTQLQGSGFAINGARPDNTNFIIDGFSSRESLFGGALTSPNLDALQEFKMQTNNFSAEYGRMAGGVMNMVLKSGTNQYHGTLFEFLRNDAVDARSFFDVRKSELRQNQFGAQIGGPVDIPKIYHGKTAPSSCSAGKACARCRGLRLRAWWPRRTRETAFSARRRLPIRSPRGHALAPLARVHAFPTIRFRSRV